MGKEMASIFPLGLAAGRVPVFQGKEVLGHVMAMNRDVQEQRVHPHHRCAKPSPGLVPSRGRLWDYQEAAALNSYSTCYPNRPWQWEASKGDMDEGQLESEGSKRAQVSW